MALRSVSSQSSVGRGKGRDRWAVALKLPIKDQEGWRQSDPTGPGAAQGRVTTQDQALHTVECTQRRMCLCPRGCVGCLSRKGCTPHSRLRKLSVDYRESILQMDTVSSEPKRFLFHQPFVSSCTARHSHSGDTGHSEMWVRVQDDLSLLIICNLYFPIWKPQHIFLVCITDYWAPWRMYLKCFVNFISGKGKLIT